MPVLLRGVGMTAAKAVGTNLVVGFAVGAVGLAAHAAAARGRVGAARRRRAGGGRRRLVRREVTGRLSELFLRRAIGIALIVIAAALAVEAAL